MWWLCPELLECAQQLYLTFPSQEAADARSGAKQTILNIRFNNNAMDSAAEKVDEPADEESSVGKAKAASPVDNSVTLSFGVHATDSVQSLERIVRVRTTQPPYL